MIHFQMGEKFAEALAWFYVFALDNIPLMQLLFLQVMGTRSYGRERSFPDQMIPKEKLEFELTKDNKNELRENQWQAYRQSQLQKLQRNKKVTQSSSASSITVSYSKHGDCTSLHQVLYVIYIMLVSLVFLQNS